MRCSLCKGKMESSNTSLPFQLEEGHMIVVKDVPALVCNQCGDSFVEIKVMRRVEKIVNQARVDGMVLGFVKFQEAA